MVLRNIGKRCHWNRKPEKLQKFRQHSAPATFIHLHCFFFCHGIILHKNWYFWPFCCKFSIISLGYEVRFISFDVFDVIFPHPRSHSLSLLLLNTNVIAFHIVVSRHPGCDAGEINNKKKRISFICWTTKASTQKRKVHSYEVHSTEVS